MITIKKKKDCCGCYACYSICPKHCVTMQCDEEGFWYPQINLAVCVNCGQCEQVCPILHSTTVKKEPHAYAAYNKDEKIRMDSSSGGIFTALAKSIIDCGGVVFGACFDQNFSVIHGYAETAKELEKFRGSKYVQSKIGDSYKQAKNFLESGRPVLFSGTPCQIAGLKSYLGKEYINLICQDIICHGVPSPKVWQKYVAFRETLAGASARRIAFRRKNEGWKRFSVSFTFKNGTEYRETLDKDLYMHAFLHNLCLRPSCYHCAFKTLNRQSDITLADFWGVEQVLPEMFDDKGTSLILINTPKGRLHFEKISKQIISRKVDLQQAIRFNPSACQSVSPNSKRRSFFKKLNNLDFEKLTIKYRTDNILIRVKRKLKNNIKKALKTSGLLNVMKNPLKK